MKSYLLVGSSSAVARNLTQKLHEEGFGLYSISRSAMPDFPGNHHTLDVLKDELPVIEEPLDGLVYFPGTIHLKPFRSLKMEDIEHDFEVNVAGAIKCLQHYLPALKKSEKASVVMFSTVAVQQGMPFHASVAISKGAIEGLVRSLAAEFAPAIRFNCIAPSLTDTPLAERLLNTPEKQASAAQRHPMKSIGKSDDLAHMVHFLLSEKSGWMTGQILHVDGGMSSLKV
jgi:NAD(P)-dependent dehydrogenase (short-subunit alcohol dehydrogenase family)